MKHTETPYKSHK